MKKFKAESKKLLDMMINSIYTHKEIFLRELISNASDAIDKLYFKAMSENLGLTRDDFKITISRDADARTLTISDNGIGMTSEDLDNNLGVICHSGTLDFKRTVTDKEVEVIGQFGVGFYSAFMVADKVEVLTKSYGSDTAYLWVSDGAEGYTVKEAEKSSHGTDIKLYLKADLEDENYSKFLDEYTIRGIVKQYSDYIRYPIFTLVTKYKDEENGEPSTYQEEEVLNSRVPLWKKSKSEVGEGEYEAFYRDKFHDYDKPLKTITTNVEGAVTFTSLLFIPSHAPFDYYTRDYEKGLQLYTNGVLIMDKCADLLPDYFSFVKGIVDSADLQLNISRETLQHNRQLKVIAQSIEKKVKTELKKMLDTDRESYEKFFKAFGLQIKFGVYSAFGAKKELLQDLLMFYSYREDRLITLDEYVAKLTDEDKYIHYLSGASIDAIKNLPQLAKVKEGEDVLLLPDDVDEFCIKVLTSYKDKQFRSVSEYESEAEKDKIEESKDMLAYIADKLSDKVKQVKLVSNLGTHASCLTTQGEISLEMEKVLNAMPGAQNKVTAERVLEINSEHKVYAKLKSLYESDKDKCADLAHILLTQAELVAGLEVDNVSEYCDRVCTLLTDE